MFSDHDPDCPHCADLRDPLGVELQRRHFMTANGVPITVGLRVFTNDLKLGTVVKLNDDGWHDVETDLPGYGGRFNGERLTTRNPFTLEVAK